ncbi:hypothetical protein ACFOYW_16370 [Gryllotalpicola reticulitermitis]|uniref:Uncharacterized protein n=1 Tax=Gryllotalpicola reticulitermitis TaxID=1184153 RepID=A0ABV8Q9D1_9MICO
MYALHRRRDPRSRTWISVIAWRGRAIVLPVVLALVAALVAVGPSVAHPEAARATVSTTGSAGLFVPASGSLLNTTNGTGGYSTPMPAGTARTVPVAGVAGLPSSGIEAVEVSIVAYNSTSEGWLDAAASNGALTVVMDYDGGGIPLATNTAIIPVGPDGKIQFRATVQTNLTVSLEGYYTAGDGTTAPGGYVPMNQVKVADTVTPVAGSGIPAGNLVGGQTYTLNVGGTNGIPADATSVFIDFTVGNSTSAGVEMKAYAADDTTLPPGVAYFEPVNPGEVTAYAQQVPLSASGQMDIAIWASSSQSVMLRAWVEGYTIPGTSAGSFTPATGRLLDTRTTSPAHVGAHSSIKVQVAGADGIPPVGSGVSALAYSLTAQASTAVGAAIAWPDGQTMPAGDDLSYDDDLRSNMQVTKLGTDGAIDIYNNSDAAADYTVDIEGWYTNPVAPTISCPAPYTNGSWQPAIPDAPVSCTVTAFPIPGDATASLNVSVDGQDYDSFTLQTNGLTEDSVLVDDPGLTTIGATVSSSLGTLSAPEYDLGLGDWGAAPVSPTPLDAADVPIPGLTLSVASDGDVFSPDVTIKYTVSTNSDMSDPVVQSGWVPDDYLIPTGVLSDGVTYYWSAEVTGLSGGRSTQTTIDSPVWSFTAHAVDAAALTTADVMGPVDTPSNGAISEDDLTAQADALSVTSSTVPDPSATADSSGVTSTDALTATANASAKTSAYAVINAWGDNKGKTVALRQGTSGWGWTHLKPHNVTQAMLARTTQHPAVRTSSGGESLRYETTAHEYVCWIFGCVITKWMTVRVIVDMTGLSDGYPKGVITAYCLDKTQVCPNWVVKAAETS